MGELCHKVKNFSQGMAVHLHGLVAVVQHDAVLMEIGIGAVLQIERFTGQVHGHNAMGLAGRKRMEAVFDKKRVVEETIKRL